MHAHQQAGGERIAAFLREWLRPALYRHRVPMDTASWTTPGEPVPVQTAMRAEFRPGAVGDRWGAPWSTSWFRFEGEIPQRFAGRRVEALLDLGFDGAGGPGDPAGALVYDDTGKPLQGLHPYQRSVLLARTAAGREPVRLLVEAAANPRITAGGAAGSRYGHPLTAGTEPLYRLRSADLVVREEDVWHLIHDVEVLDELMRALPEALPRRHEIRRALERAADAVDPGDVPGTAARARGLLAPALARRAHESAHTAVAVGHAHTGSAWLWPGWEAVRRSVRTFANAVTLAEEYPELVVAGSSAQTYAWVKEHQPETYDRVLKAIAVGNWAPVGGMWVEADGTLPGGESLARQFGHGRRFFRDELGVDTDGVWLPGSAGATAAYPQLARLAGARWFLTRARSHDGPDRLPHHTFRWEGIDGSRVFTHRSPAGAHDAELTGAELADAVADFAGKGDGTRSLVPFGYGDGGGGPTASMLERARRLADLEGSARVEIRHPSAFFQQAAEEYEDAPVWRGELPAQPYGGAYTGQARTKRGNRRSEALLREAELWSATVAVREGAAYPYEELAELWQQVLLNQVHGVLPGTAIAWVHQEAEQSYARIHRRLERIVERASASGGGAAGGADGESAGVLNAGPHPRREVVVLDGAPPAPGAQRLGDGRWAAFAEAPALGRGIAGRLPAGTAPVTVREAGGAILLDNGMTKVAVDARGLVTSVVDLASGRDAMAPGEPGNVLQLHPEGPSRPGAGSAHNRPAHRDLTEALSVEATERGPLLARVRVTRTTGRSVIVQDLTLTAGGRALVVDTDVDWRERDTLLKLAWPLDVHAEVARAEIQYGHVARPTHENADGDAARGDVWAHRWIHVGEHNWGVALAADSTYGHDVGRAPRDRGGTTTTVRFSLLRAPYGPDPHADRGGHRFSHSLRPGADVRAAIAEGYALNLPMRAAMCAAPPDRPLLAVDNPDVVVEAVKLADDRSGDVVVRLYESRGGRARAGLTADFPVHRVHETDLLEEPLTEHPCVEGRVALSLRPFEILTLRLARPRRGADD
ncbi:alpha-mannosidase [Streptomyces sp. 184]|uniref:alpha-mannosidase n=1 Tax=Streptomyces sp. 184 TaxID=1827526 RepID=UPI0038916949